MTEWTALDVNGHLQIEPIRSRSNLNAIIFNLLFVAHKYVSLGRPPHGNRFYTERFPCHQHIQRRTRNRQRLATLSIPPFLFVTTVSILLYVSILQRNSIYLSIEQALTF